MRKFTKEHNDLVWLFPTLNKDKIESENYFDYYELMANLLYKKAHNNNETLTKDDVIDGFMKGASTAHSRLLNSIEYLNGHYEILKKEVELLRKQNKQLMELIFKLTNNDSNK